MKNGRSPFSYVTTLVLLTLPILAAGTQAHDSHGDRWLVRVEAKDGESVNSLLESGFNVVKNMTEAYFLTGDEGDLVKLRKLGYRFSLLDENPDQKEYYLVLLRPGMEASIVEPCAELLTTVGRYALVSSSTERIRQTLPLGVEIERLRLSAIRPLYESPLSPPVVEWNGLIQSMADSISQSVIEGHVDDLVAFGTRRSDTPGGVAAQNYLLDYYQSLGIDSVYLHDFDGNADNVIAVIPGIVNPDEIYIIGAHYDSYTYSPGDAPGADDNGSGTACVMEVARIMSCFFYDKTIIFCGWASEEFGLIGSSYWADEAAANGYNILGYLNLDMEGYVQSGDITDLDVISNTESTPLRDAAFQVASEYVPTLPLVDGYLFGASSDHASFWDAGYQAIFLFEDSDEYSPYIHTTDDIVGLSLNNFPFCTDICRVAVSWMATMAEPFNVAIFHSPLPNTEETEQPYEVTARIIGATPILEDSVFVHYATGGEFTDIPMTGSGPDEFSASIPAQPSGTMVSYYISAVDSAGNLGTDPWGAPEAVHRFLVKRIDFINISATSGTDDSGFGEGIAWGDYNGDGLEDLFVANYGGENSLYRNDGGGVFIDVGAAAGVDDSRTCFAASWSDYDNDGLLDFYVGVRYGTNTLYHNNGDGTFTDTAAGTGVAGSDSTYTQGVAWADFDNDGNLDLYVVNRYLDNVLYRNNGNETFTNIASGAGVTGGGTCQTALWADYDGDGLIDLFLTRQNDDRCLLYHNNGDWTFTETGIAAGLADEGNWAGADWGDVDNDGDLDLFIACSGCRDALFTNDGDGTFTDVSVDAGITGTTSSRSPNLTDFDNDGLLDIHISAGGPNLFYLSMGDGSFIELGGIAELGDSGPGEGSATADVDLDGLLDVYTANSQFIPNILYKNDNGGNNFLSLRLEGTRSNRSSIGAVVRLYSENLAMTRQVRSTSGLYSEESLTVEFGLGGETVADSIVVTWPGGKTRKLTNISANQFLNVKEPGFPTWKEAVEGF